MDPNSSRRFQPLVSVSELPGPVSLAEGHGVDIPGCCKFLGYFIVPSLAFQLLCHQYKKIPCLEILLFEILRGDFLFLLESD